MDCVKCRQKADFSRDLNVPTKLLHVQTQYYGTRSWSRQKKYTARRLRIGFCNRCVRRKISHSHHLAWSILFPICAAAMTTGLFAGVWKGQPVSTSLVLLFLWAGTVLFGREFVRKVLVPQRVKNEDIVRWFRKEILAASGTSEKTCPITYDFGT
jgi:hypothetical protein